MVCLCLGSFFSKLFHNRHQKCIQKQAQKKAQIKVDKETKLNTEMNRQSNVITEQRLGMREITEEEYDRGIIDYRTYKPITITVIDVHGVTHVQEVIDFNPSVSLGEVTQPERVEMAGEELSGSQEKVEMVEDNHTAITGELNARGSLQMVKDNPTTITKESSDKERLRMVEDNHPSVTEQSSDRESLQILDNNHPAIINDPSDKESLEMIAIDMNGHETRIRWRGIMTPERKKSYESMR
ncbi:uncharacterized protein EAF01_001135 [Botrytis porri]|uniref:uncharacterized protein n=1 Tax=Botrytis porri TaxID=87229 RepID=UPI0018FF1A9F|nr:uncharacterized protein EAF01_001135 [Botrytis porri]KAF7912114.1 hypothetical protein EAF01_001135 [Botrytis porri]